MAVVMRDHSVTYQPLTTHTHTRLKALCPGLPGWAGTRKVKPIWILLKQETVSGSGISWASRKFASCSRQITTPVPHHSVFTGRMPFLSPNQQHQSTKGTQQPTCHQLPTTHKFTANHTRRCFQVIELHRPLASTCSLSRWASNGRRLTWASWLVTHQDGIYPPKDSKPSPY